MYESINTVSYTHLDVYKRQMLERKIRITHSIHKFNHNNTNILNREDQELL